MQYQQPFLSQDEEENFDLKFQVAVYLKYWKWFVLSVVLTLSLAYAYLYFAKPQFKATSTILVKDDKKGGLDSQLDAFADLGLVGKAGKNIDNEIEVIKSRSLIANTVRELGYNVIYSAEGRVREIDLYRKSPVTLLFSEVPEDFYDKNHTFQLKNWSANGFEAFEGDQLLGRFNFGQPVSFSSGKFLALKKTGIKFIPQTQSPIKIAVVPLAQTTASYKGRLNVAAINKTSSVIELSIVDPVKEKAEDFIKKLIQTYNDDAIADKNFISENTSKFIEERIKLISKELGDVEKENEVFKSSHKVTDITSEASIFLANASEFEKKAIEIETQIKVVQAMTDYLNKMSDQVLIPANLLGEKGGAAESITLYNQLVLDRNRLMKNAGVDNIAVLNLNKKLASLKEEIRSALARQKEALEITLKDLERQNALVSGRISKIPTLERQALELGRQQHVKEELYLYLLKKREETAIMLAQAEPTAKVIDEALSDDLPVSPKKNIVFLAAFLLGLLIPFGVIYIIGLLDSKVQHSSDLLKTSQIPFLGEIPISETPDEMITTSSNSSSAEALRIVRTNLDFMLNKVEEGVAKTVFVTSTLPKEGKTFVSVNLAGSLALTGKKVLLVGMDIRNPKIHKYLSLDKTEGLTNYLMQHHADINQYIVQHSGLKDFYILPSGILPPNPTELLMDERIESLFKTLKKDFDYIVVDTAPVGVVADTLVISKYADTFVYVVRAHMLEKNMLQIPRKLYEENRLPNMSFLLNCTRSMKGYGYYGYHYGYGYDAKIDKKSWYAQLFK